MTPTSRTPHRPSSDLARAHGGERHNNDLGKPRFTKAYGFGLLSIAPA